MTTTSWTVEPVGTDTVQILLGRLADARTRAVSWLEDRIGDDGRPDGADVANSWWRAPWALCVGGAPDAAAAMIGWAEREALTDDGDLRAGPYGGDGPGTPVYSLSPIAIAAWLLTRYGTANLVMDRIAYWTDPDTGGAYEYKDHDQDPLQDMLKTSQVGISALVTGRTDLADGVYRWLQAAWAAQPDLPRRLYPSVRGGEPVADFASGDALLRVVDFQSPRQLYFHSGIAGAFLAGYGQQFRDTTAIGLGNRYLELNKTGTVAQFDDTSSVQICKFGWGVAAMQTADPTSGQLPWLVRMGQWFVDRQRPDGSWAPSSFTTPDPGLLDYYWKTAEHLMELSYIQQALAGSDPTP